MLAALLGALLVGAIWYAVERNDSDDVRGDSLHLTVPATTSTTEKTTVVASTPTTVLETSTIIPVENITATTIVVETPLVPKPVPVVPSTIVINSPAEATVPATNEVVEPAVVIVDVPPIDPVIIAPVTETPMAAPELNTANLASFNPAKWPYENAVKVGAQKPGEYVQHVLDEYNARYGRQFIWNHQNGMFYEGKHIINRSELNSYYDIFKELSDHETAGLPITA